MRPTFGPATKLTQGITLAVVLALTTLVVALSEPEGRPALASASASPSLAVLAQTQPAAPLDVRVQMRSALGRTQVLAAVRRAGGVPLGTVANELRARMSAAAAVALTRRPDVLGVSVITR